jgi:hypothetical protein
VLAGNCGERERELLYISETRRIDSGMEEGMTRNSRPSKACPEGTGLFFSTSWLG